MVEQGQRQAIGHEAIGVTTDAIASMKCSACGAAIDASAFASFETVTCPSCGKDNTVPARLGSFLLLQLLGTGGMGGVFYARDETLGRDVAIKVMLKSLGDDPQFNETFKREAQAIARLNHPHIAQIYSFGQEKGQPYIVMELVKGQRLDKLIESGEPLNQAMIMRVGLEIAQGLSAADEAGLVHGDIKPENILFDKKGNSKLVDFGLACAKHQADDGGIWGTPYYIAPERVLRQSVDARADIYSLGATLFHALTGHPPFEGETPVAVVKARLTEPPPPLHSYREDIDEDVERIVLRMLDADLARRYPTYLSLINDIRRVLDKLTGPSAQTGSHRKSIRLGRKAPVTASGMSPVKNGSEGVKSRIVIRKGGGNAPVPTVQAGPKSIRLAGKGQPKAEVAAQDPVELAAAGDRKRAERRRRSRQTLVVLAVLLFLGLGAAVAAALVHRRNQRLDQRREWFAFQDVFAAASNRYDRIRERVAGIDRLAESGVARIDPLGEHVEIVTGAPFVVPERQPRQQPADEDGALTDDDTGRAEDDAVNRDQPPEDVEEPEALPDAEEGEDDMPSDDGADDIPQAFEVVSEVVPPIVEKARSAVTLIYQLQNLAADAGDIGAKAAAVQARVIAARRSAAIRPLTNDLGRIADDLEALWTEAHAHDKALADKVREIQDEREAFQAAAATALRLDREREERLRAEAEQRLETERQQRRIEHELAIVGGVTNAVRAHHREHDFAKAITEIEARLETIETAEATEVLRVVLARYRKLEGLKSFLITRLNEHPFEWGWIQESSARDILGADEKGIRVRGRPEAVPWVAVTPRQVLHMIDHYLAHAGTLASHRTRQTMAAAVYCYEIGGERGLDLARRYFDQALTLRYRQEEAMRLLPLGW